MLDSILFDLAADFICAGLVILRFRYISGVYRIVGWYQVLSALVNIAGLMLVKMKLPNVFLFSVYALISFGLLQYFCYRKFQKKRLIFVSMIPVVLFWTLESAYGGIYYFPAYFLLFQSVILIISFFALLYQSALTTNTKLRHNPDFFIGLAVVLFYGCMTHQLIFNINSPTLSLKKSEIELLGVLTRFYSNTKSVLLCIGFILEIKRNKAMLI